MNTVVVVQALSCVQPFATMRTVAQQAPIYRISQARVLEWVAISFSTGSSWPRNQTHVCCIGRWSLYHWTIKEAMGYINKNTEVLYNPPPDK